MSADPQSVLESLGRARRFADPEAPLDGRLMAARGALPLPPHEVAGVLFALTLDPDPEVKDTARSSLEGLPERIVDAVLVADVHPSLLGWFAERFCDDEARLEKIALNAATSDATFCILASRPFRRIVDIVSQNQVRVLRCAELVDKLGENPLASQATLDRILHFLGVERGESEEEATELPEERAPAPPPPADADTTEAPLFDAEDASGLPDELTLDPEEDETADDAQQEDKSRSLHSLIQDLNVMQKIKLARFGNGEARGLLIRDRNKLVATAAIRSPKINEGEVTTYAKSRNLHDEVTRIICNNREWTKNYQVKHALVMNPKTPTQTAIKFINYLTDRDLKTIMRSRDVPGPVSGAARRLLTKKGKL